MPRIPLVTHPEYSFPFPGHHRFPMEKFGLLVDYLTHKGLITASNTHRPGKIRDDVLALAHSADYISGFKNNQWPKALQRRMGLPWSPALVKRSFISPNGTLLTASLALNQGIACHLAGGTHHAHYDFASGFCIFNDLAATALALLAMQKVKRVLIFDVDVHQGDGTARILANEPNAITVSVHCEKNFPVRKALSDWDIGLKKGMADDEYLAITTSSFAQALKRYKPDLVLYDAGVDVYEHDPLGLLNITEAAIYARDQNILQQCKTQGIPVATVIGGGYDDDRKALARRHAYVVEAAFKVFG